ncbi:MAG TPA: hypothetical protein VGQ59_09710, partial [Cyclobacteriaceae bacterium]|nr:hypothetical protein [Cyclobacteriaceae bacterium]
VLASTVIAAIGVIVVLILLAFSIVGLLGGAFKEVFYYITSQGFSNKATSSDSSQANVLVTQE